ncbi:MAG: hypothetical protein ABIO24_03760, partial [Saprospiraceae bacterium]
QFLADAARTLSPYAMSKVIEYPLFGFRFTPTQLQGFTMHEGGYDCDLKYDPATKKYTSKGIPGVPGFEMMFQPDGTIQLTYFRLKKTYTFRKVADIDTALRQVMFAGTYTDSKTKTTVEFKADGTLTGLGTPKTYLPFYDYVAGPLDFDEMRVSEKSDASKESYYHYKFKGNTLELYEAIQPKENDQAGMEKIGGLRYTLVRS